MDGSDRQAFSNSSIYGFHRQCRMGARCIHSHLGGLSKSSGGLPEQISGIRGEG